MKKPAKVKKILFLAAAMVLILAVAIGGTMAYYTKTAKSESVITMGNIRIALHDVTDKAEVPDGEDRIVMPGDTVNRTVTVENTGTHPAFVRIRFKNGFGTEEEKDSFVSLDFNTEKWAQYGSFWYYKGILEAGAETEPLFTEVTFLDDIDGAFDGDQYALEFTAYAVQQENNGTDPLKAVGWPEIK